MLTHPLALIPESRRPIVFGALLTLTIAVMLVLRATGEPLSTAAAAQGIVSFALAGSVTQAQSIVASWDAGAQLRATFGLGLDYLFMLAYAAAIAMACLWSAQKLQQRGWPLAEAGAPLAWGLLLAAALDAVENAALLTMLWGTVSAPWPLVSFWCAAIKFALVALGFVYAAYGATAALSSRRAGG